MSNNQNRGMDRQHKAATGGAGPIKFRFRGHGYTIPDQENWTIDALLLMAEMEDQPQKAIMLVRELLGDGQFQAMKDRHNNVKAFNEFVGAMFAEVEKRSGGEDAPKS